MQKGYVYFICENRHQEVGFDFIKIGYTSNNNISKRIVTLQIGNPRKLEVLCVLETESIMRAKEIEKMCHDILKEDQVSGEWFRVTDKVRDFILEKIPGYGTVYNFQKHIPKNEEQVLCNSSLLVNYEKKSG